MVSAPLVAVPPAAAWPRSPRRGRILRWVGSSSKSPYKGRLGRPPISFALPLPAPPRRRTRQQIGHCRRRAWLPGQQIRRKKQRRRRHAGSPPALASVLPPTTTTTHDSRSSQGRTALLDPIHRSQHCPCPPSPYRLPPLRQQRGRPTLVALMATLPHMRVIIDVRSLLVR